MTRLKRFSKNENSKKKIIIGIYAFLIIGIILTGASYAVYQREAEVLFINATVGEFKENDIELAMKLNGEQVDTPPTKDNYTVTVDCDNADGSWDMNEWLAKIGNISAGKVKCEVNFVTPEPTLSEVTATADKTSIALSYTAGGIGTNTTCVYGTDTNYGSTVEGATNSNCNITELDYDTTYYYKVCAKNAGGEVCKEGSIKTKPNSDPISKVNVGDYISMTPTATSYTISKDLTGYTSDQTINPSELNLWRVIKKNDNGTVEMVSEYVSSKNVYFRGQTGYINLVGGLNTIASQYTDGKHVQSTRHIGYVSQTRTITSTSKLTQTKAPWTKSTSDSTSWLGCSTSSYLCGTDESLGAGDISYAGDRNLVSNVCGTMRANNPSGTATEYWLASRLFNYSGSTQWYFSGRYVNTSGDLRADGLSGWIPGGNTYQTYSGGFAVRPIVTLISTSEIKGGIGSGAIDSPYELF